MRSPWVESVTVTIKEAPPLFGREKPLKLARAALSKGQHVFIHGEFGIGKTTFAKAVAIEEKRKFGVLSLQDSVATSLGRMILDAKRKSLLHGSKPVTYRRQTKRADRLVDLKKHLLFLKEKRSLDTLILDNFFSISHPKLDFVHFLVEHGFTLIVVLESEVHENDIFRLRAACQPQIQLTLAKLSRVDSERVFRHWNEEYSLELTEEEVVHLARLEIGYPLFMKEKLGEIRAQQTAALEAFKK